MHAWLISSHAAAEPNLTSVLRFVDAGHDPAPTDGSVLALAVPAPCPRSPPFNFLSPPFFFLLPDKTSPSFLAFVKLPSQEVVPGASNGLVRSVPRMVHLALTRVVLLPLRSVRRGCPRANMQNAVDRRSLACSGE